MQNDRNLQTNAMGYVNQFKIQGDNVHVYQGRLTTALI